MEKKFRSIVLPSICMTCITGDVSQVIQRAFFAMSLKDAAKRIDRATPRTRQRAPETWEDEEKYTRVISIRATNDDFDRLRRLARFFETSHGAVLRGLLQAMWEEQEPKIVSLERTREELGAPHDHPDISKLNGRGKRARAKTK